MPTSQPRPHNRFKFLWALFGVLLLPITLEMLAFVVISTDPNLIASAQTFIASHEWIDFLLTIDLYSAVLIAFSLIAISVIEATEDNIPVYEFIIKYSLTFFWLLGFSVFCSFLAIGMPFFINQMEIVITICAVISILNIISSIHSCVRKSTSTSTPLDWISPPTPLDSTLTPSDALPIPSQPLRRPITSLSTPTPLDSTLTPSDAPPIPSQPLRRPITSFSIDDYLVKIDQLKTYQAASYIRYDEAIISFIKESNLTLCAKRKRKFFLKTCHEFDILEYSPNTLPSPDESNPLLYDIVNYETIVLPVELSLDDCKNPSFCCYYTLVNHFIINGDATTHPITRQLMTLDDINDMALRTFAKYGQQHQNALRTHLDAPLIELINRLRPTLRSHSGSFATA